MRFGFVRSVCPALIIGLCAAASAAPVRLDSLRVWQTEPASFDYTFTSVVTSAGARPVLAFNHRSGRTFFVKPGDKLGRYTVKSFAPATERVFNPSTNSYHTKQTGRVTLVAPDGRVVRLEQGEPLPQPGRLVTLAALDTGDLWAVQKGDMFSFHDADMKLVEASEDSAAVSVTGHTRTISKITQEETDRLITRWREAARQREWEQELAARRAEERRRAAWVDQVPAPAARRPRSAATVRHTPRMFFGTDYPWPVEFQVIPPVYNAAGRLVRSAIVIPTRFERRAYGMGVEYP